MLKRTLKCLMLCFLVINLFLVSVPAGSYAAFEPSPWTENAGYNKKMFGKFLFGLANVIAGSTEILTEPYEAVKEDRMFWKGVGEGLFNGVVDTVGGALHIVTFFITPLDIQLPEGGTDIGEKRMSD